MARRAFPLEVERAGRISRVEIVPDERPTRWDGWIGNVVLLWIASFAALIGWRRPAMPEARLVITAVVVEGKSQGEEVARAFGVSTAGLAGWWPGSGALRPGRPPVTPRWPAE